MLIFLFYEKKTNSIDVWVRSTCFFDAFLDGIFIIGIFIRIKTSSNSKMILTFIKLTQEEEKEEAEKEEGEEKDEEEGDKREEEGGI